MQVRLQNVWSEDLSMHHVTFESTVVFKQILLSQTEIHNIRVTYS